MKPFKGLMSVLTCLMICVLLSFQTAAAGYADGSRDIADESRDVNLTISYQDGEVPLSGAEFDIYLVALADPYGGLTVTDEFSRFPVDIIGNMEDAGAWRTLAATLEGYVLRDQLEPADSGKTDTEGMLRFPQQGKDGQGQSGSMQMEQGLYLVIGHRHLQDGFYYDASPFMILLPEQGENGEWIYDVTAQVKYDSVPVPEEKPDTVNRKVLKIWKDSDAENERPEKVVIQLLRDGSVYDTVTLNDANNWRYTWNDLDAAYRWTVVEKEIKDYTVEMTREGITFIVTNTYDGDIPEEPTEESSDSSSSESSQSESSSGSSGGSSSSGGHGRLPQTGQLWWPVPVLAFSGFLFVLTGVIRRRKGSDEEK